MFVALILSHLRVSLWHCCWETSSSSRQRDVFRWLKVKCLAVKRPGVNILCVRRERRAAGLICVCLGFSFCRLLFFNTLYKPWYNPALLSDWGSRSGRMMRQETRPCCLKCAGFRCLLYWKKTRSTLPHVTARAAGSVQSPPFVRSNTFESLRVQQSTCLMLHLNMFCSDEIYTESCRKIHFLHVCWEMLGNYP